MASRPDLAMREAGTEQRGWREADRQTHTHTHTERQTDRHRQSKRERESIAQLS